jgi:hypothetical protein
MMRKSVGGLLAALAVLLLPVPASATFHLMKIVEVFAGTDAEPTAQYVMLQMYFAGQNFVAGHTVVVFAADGTRLGTFTFAMAVPNGANAAHILIATPDAEALFGVTADLEMAAVIPAGGGAVCYDVIDCVAWGTFSAPSALPVPPGSPFNVPTGLLAGMAMHRTLGPGGSITDVAFAAPRPINNAGQTGMLGATPTMPPEDTPTASATVTPTATLPEETPTVSATDSPTMTPPEDTPTPSATATPPPTMSAPACVGDCDRDQQVTLNELLILVNIALGAAPSSACTNGIPTDTQVTIGLIIQAVNAALSQCPSG